MTDSFVLNETTITHYSYNYVSAFINNPCIRCTYYKKKDICRLCINNKEEIKKPMTRYDWAYS